MEAASPQLVQYNDLGSAASSFHKHVLKKLHAMLFPSFLSSDTTSNIDMGSVKEFIPNGTSGRCNLELGEKTCQRSIN